MDASRRYWIRTYGCQMNVHDSDKVANLLHHDGWSSASELDDANLLIINTCSIRDKAEHRLYSDLGKLRDWKRAGAARILAVAGCVAQQQGDALLRRFSHLDFVYGTHQLRHVPAMVESALRGTRQSHTEESSSHERFDFPVRHPDFAGDRAGRAFLTVMEGCDMFCSFCIVPLTRGREISRPAAEILAEARALVVDGVREITLLGQTVNAYGRHDLRRERESARRRNRSPRPEPAHEPLSFSGLLSQLAEIPQLARIRYVSPHPLFFDEELIRAHGELGPLCPHVHLPVQSGSDRVLERMRRGHTRDEYRSLTDRLRDSRPDLAITTDLIVGFPGETDADFDATLKLVREVGFTDGFAFKYSPRPGTAAAQLPLRGDGGGAVPESVAQERLEQLQELQRSLTLASHRARVGQTTQVLVEGPSRRGGNQRTGRDPFHRVVNFTACAGGPAPGSLVGMKIVDATPHSLIGERQAAPALLQHADPAADSGAVAVKVSAETADERGRGVFGA